MSITIPLISQMGAEEELLWLEKLEQLTPQFKFVAAGDLSNGEKTQCEVALVANPKPEEVASFTNLKWVQSLWAGVERLLSELPDDRLMVSRLIDPQLADTMAEAVLAWTLFLHRDMPTYAQQQTKKQWRACDFVLAKDRQVGILGMGQLGDRAASRLRNNGFPVLGWNRRGVSASGEKVLSGDAGLTEILVKSDILVVLLPLTAETRGLLGQENLSLLPKGANLINFARGPIINDDALMSALDAGDLKHAVLDVFATEPLPQEHKYWSHASVTVLPHISAPTNMDTAAKIVCGNLDHYFKTGEMLDLVDRAKGY